MYIFRPIGENTELETKYSKLFELTEKMLSHIKNKRPNCEEILRQRVSWGLSLSELQNNANYELGSASDHKFYFGFIEMKSKYKNIIL